MNSHNICKVTVKDCGAVNHNCNCGKIHQNDCLKKSSAGAMANYNDSRANFDDFLAEISKRLPEGFCNDEFIDIKNYLIAGQLGDVFTKMNFTVDVFPGIYHIGGDYWLIDTSRKISLGNGNRIVQVLCQGMIHFVAIINSRKITKEEGQTFHYPMAENYFEKNIENSTKLLEGFTERFELLKFLASTVLTKYQLDRFIYLSSNGGESVYNTLSYSEKEELINLKNEMATYHHVFLTNKTNLKFTNIRSLLDNFEYLPREINNTRNKIIDYTGELKNEYEKEQERLKLKQECRYKQEHLRREERLRQEECNRQEHLRQARLLQERLRQERERQERERQERERQER